MKRLGPNQIAWRRLCLEVLPARPAWTLRQLAELRIGLTPVAAERAVLRLESEGLVNVVRPEDGPWRISWVWPNDLAELDRWITAELEGNAHPSSTLTEGGRS